jgi:hypothetical protein
MVFKQFRSLPENKLLKELSKTKVNSKLYNQINKILNERKNLKPEFCREALLELEREKFRRFKPIHLGNKNEPYFTEEEMLEGFKVTYEELSPEEKELYNYNDEE